MMILAESVEWVDLFATPITVAPSGRAQDGFRFQRTHPTIHRGRIHGFAEFIIGPAVSRARWRNPSYALPQQRHPNGYDEPPVAPTAPDAEERKPRAARCLARGARGELQLSADAARGHCTHARDGRPQDEIEETSKGIT
jgi:hypothetical protein